MAPSNQMAQPMAQHMPYPSPRWGYADPAAAQYQTGAEQYAQQCAILPWYMYMPNPPIGFRAPQGIVPPGVAHPAQHEQEWTLPADENDGDEGAESEDEDESDNADQNDGDEDEQDKEDDDQHAMAVYCQECQTWLNGPRQFEDHKIGKKHQKNMAKQRRGCTRDVVAQPEAPQPVVVEEPEKKTAMWQWLEDGRVAKQAESNQLEGDKIQKEGRSARRRRHKQEKEARVAAENASSSSSGKPITVVPPRDEFVGQSTEKKMPTLLEQEQDEGLEPTKSKVTEHQKYVGLALSAVTGVGKPITVVPPRDEFVGKSISNPQVTMEAKANPKATEDVDVAAPAAPPAAG